MHHRPETPKPFVGRYPRSMRSPLDDEALAVLAKELITFYLQCNKLDPGRGAFDQVLTRVIEHAMTYAFRIGYRKRTAEEGAEDRLVS
jgi:hypothetical protein